GGRTMKAQRRGRCSEAGQVVVQPRIDGGGAALAAQGFDQPQVGRQLLEKTQLEPALVPFAGGVGVVHDATAGMAAQCAVGGDVERADRYVELEVAVGGDPADRAAV